jgi:prolyl-tRNA synthetase
MGLDALLNAPDEHPVKFENADLIGVPFRIVVGKKLAGGMVEVVDRKTKQRVDLVAGRLMNPLCLKIQIPPTKTQAPGGSASVPGVLE